MSEPWSNRWAAPPACPECNDIRMVTTRVEARDTDRVKCPKCGLLSREEYERFRHDAWARNSTTPSICELDLDLNELQTFKRLREEHPKLSKLTVLSWIEGQRYDPSKDQEFLTQAREEFKKWRSR